MRVFIEITFLSHMHLKLVLTCYLYHIYFIHHLYYCSV